MVLCKLIVDNTNSLKGPALLVKKNYIYFAFNTARTPISVHKKFQPIRSSRLAGYKQHISECFVLLYR